MDNVVIVLRPEIIIINMIVNPNYDDDDDKDHVNTTGHCGVPS